MARARIEDQRREEILAAFEACVIRQGLSSTTLADVAEEAGLPRSLVRYFVGNRDDMVDLLIARMVSRAEAELTNLREHEGRARSAHEVVDFLFDRVFADETSNAVVGELWYLAQRDDEMRGRLETVYSRVVRELVRELRRDPSVRASKRLVEEVAFALLSLAYGEVSFRLLGMSSTSRGSTRRLAHDMLVSLMRNRQAEGRK